jgi:hypothetical protein
MDSKVFNPKKQLLIKLFLYFFFKKINQLKKILAQLLYTNHVYNPHKSFDTITHRH